ncbi:MAG: hypothetical protein GF349_04900 [Candidatus Magasanikbacteria bacterium]|nr:hypothetical protein [Candidatus Magasanikbacteria bacterium]
MGSVLSLGIIYLMFAPFQNNHKQSENIVEKESLKPAEIEDPVAYLKCKPETLCHYRVTYYEAISECDRGLFVRNSSSAEVVIIGADNSVPIFFGAEIEILEIDSARPENSL